MGKLGNWIKGTGSYEVKEMITQDGVLKDLDVGIKYLECTTAGTIALPSTQAYGTWEFDLYKGADANIFYIKFINDIIDTGTLGSGYTLLMSGGEELVLLQSATPIFATATSYIANSTWYRIKITRTKDGEFYVYIKGGSFGINDWTEVDHDTENTYIESKYIVLDFDVGDRITNIKVLNDVKQ